MKIAKIITGVIIVLVVALAMGLIFKFTNGFNEDFKTFYLERDGKQILTGETETSFTCGESYRYEVKYTFDNDKSEPKGYNVKIVPNGKIKLMFKADGKQYSYADAKELTGAFDIKKEASAFTLATPKGLSLKTVLEKAYEKEVEVDEPQGALYTLVVSSYNGKVTYKINFGVSTKVEGIELDKDGIVFGGEGEIPPSVPQEPPKEETQKYGIEYDTLGSGSVLSVKFGCVSEAAAGEEVRFTVEVLNEELEVVNLMIESEEVYEYDYTHNKDGSYTFTMPDCFVTVMIYLMPKEA